MRRHCKSCGNSHEKPTGRGCKYQADMPSQATGDDVGTESIVLGVLRDIQTTVSRFDERLKAVENTQALGARPLPGQNNTEMSSPDKDGTQIPMATPDTLRADHSAMAEVAARLAEWGLADDETPGATTMAQGWRNRARRSGTVSTGTDSIKTVIDWPHFHIRKGQKCTTPEYEEITSEEFVLGFLRMLDDTQNDFDNKRMLELLRDVMEDAVDFGWDRARSFYGMIGLGVEHRRLRWSDKEHILKLRLTHSRTVLPPPSTPKPQKQSNPTTKIKTCAPFQKGSCDQTGDHNNFKHACDYCLRVRGLVFPHPEGECRTKKYNGAKNGQ